ncbi:MAG: 3-methyl-2-oxobutanoate hydroxymethyltransferase, partial [Verrucomicrobiales bacterium]
MTALQKADTIRLRKGGRPIAALTAYDYPTARLLDECGVDVLLVGDSLGMVVLGFPDTTHVTLDHMLHHVAAVARAKPRALIIGDLPIHTYETPGQALETARRLVAAGAEAVKLEGGSRQAEKV